MKSEPPFQFDSEAIQLLVRVVPRARSNEATGWVDVGQGRSALAIRVRAPASEGAANAELIRFLAEALGIARTAVTLESGARSRLKRLRVSGADPQRLERLLKR